MHRHVDPVDRPTCRRERERGEDYIGAHTHTHPFGSFTHKTIYSTKLIPTRKEALHTITTIFIKVQFFFFS